MLEENKQEEIAVLEDVQKPYYYSKNSLKVGDFVGGFLIAVVSYVIVVFVSFIATVSSFVWLLPFNFLFLPVIIASILMCLLILGSVIAFKRGRSFLAIGMITAYLIPLLLFGSCLTAQWPFLMK